MTFFSLSVNNRNQLGTAELYINQIDLIVKIMKLTHGCILLKHKVCNILFNYSIYIVQFMIYISAN